MQIEIAGNTWTLLPQKAVWIDFCKTLLISDVHLGKIEHFRKNGLALPPAAAAKSWETLFALQAMYQPDRIIFLGDLFHSKLNNSYLDMRRFRDQTAQVEILLIEGNHDILHPELYRQLDILLLPELKEMGCLFTHEPYPDEETGDWVNVCGHIHPAIRMVGKGRQSLRLPCYYRTETQFILPAFGYFTGMSLVRKKANSSIFAIAGEEIFSV